MRNEPFLDSASLKRESIHSPAGQAVGQRRKTARAADGLEGVRDRKTMSRPDQRASGVVKALEPDLRGACRAGWRDQALLLTSGAPETSAPPPRLAGERKAKAAEARCGGSPPPTRADQGEFVKEAE